MHNCSYYVVLVTTGQPNAFFFCNNFPILAGGRAIKQAARGASTTSRRRPSSCSAWSSQPQSHSLNQQLRLRLEGRAPAGWWHLAVWCMAPDLDVGASSQSVMERQREREPERQSSRCFQTQEKQEDTGG